jgi:hypothetical protein
MDVVEDDGPGALQAKSGQGCAVGPEVRICLVPGVMEDGLEVQGRNMGGWQCCSLEGLRPWQVHQGIEILGVESS